MAISNQQISDLGSCSGACDRELVIIERDLSALRANVSQLTPARLLPALEGLERAANQLSRAIHILAEGHREERNAAAAARR